jgi:predicted KAP-like P-loop ATPase
MVQYNFNDSPISRPENDKYGFDQFARAIARSIERMATPDGTVIAVNGPWGSGKSSAINLIQHHLRPAEQQERIKSLIRN